MTHNFFFFLLKVQEHLGPRLDFPICSYSGYPTKPSKVWLWPKTSPEITMLEIKSHESNQHEIAHLLWAVSQHSSHAWGVQGRGSPPCLLAARGLGTQPYEGSQGALIPRVDWVALKTGTRPGGNPSTRRSFHVASVSCGHWSCSSFAFCWGQQHSSLHLLAAQPALLSLGWISPFMAVAILRASLPVLLLAWLFCLLQCLKTADLCCLVKIAQFLAQSLWQIVPTVALFESMDPDGRQMSFPEQNCAF